MCMRATFVLFPYLLSVVCGGQVMSQVRKTQTITSYNMNTAKNNEESIRYLYDQILNERRIEQLEIIVDETYVNEQGETGLAGFKKGITNVLTGFPDARWNVEHLVADDNRVMVKQTMTGTHTGVFQNIPPTGKKISNNGYVMYEFDHGKIVRHQILTDRLSFLQQLGVLPVDVGPAPRAKDSVVYFVDRFLIPQASLDEFISRMQYNRDFIRQLPGFIHDKVIVRQVDEDKVSLVTI